MEIEIRTNIKQNILDKNNIFSGDNGAKCRKVKNI